MNTYYTITLTEDERDTIEHALTIALANSRTTWHSRTIRTLLRRIGWNAAGWPTTLTTRYQEGA